MACGKISERGLAWNRLGVNCVLHLGNISGDHSRDCPLTESWVTLNTQTTSRKAQPKVNWDFYHSSDLPIHSLLPLSQPVPPFSLQHLSFRFPLSFLYPNCWWAFPSTCLKLSLSPIPPNLACWGKAQAGRVCSFPTLLFTRPPVLPTAVAQPAQHRGPRAGRAVISRGEWEEIASRHAAFSASLTRCSGSGSLLRSPYCSLR